MNLTTFSDRATKENALKDVYSVLVNSYRTVAGGFSLSTVRLIIKTEYNVAYVPTKWETEMCNDS